MNTELLPKTKEEYLDAMHLAESLFTEKDEFWESLRDNEADPEEIRQAYEEMKVIRNVFWIVNSEWKKQHQQQYQNNSNTNRKFFMYGFCIGVGLCLYIITHFILYH